MHTLVCEPEMTVDNEYVFQLAASHMSGPLLDPRGSPWTHQEVEASWAAYKQRMSAAVHGSGFHVPPSAPQAVKDYAAKLQGSTAVSAEVMQLDIPPLAREELESRIMSLGRGKKNPTAARETLKAIKHSGPVRVSPETAAFIYEELLAAKKMMSTDPHMRSDPYFQYQLLGINTALKNMSKMSQRLAARGPASAVLGMVKAAREDLLDGAELDLEAIQALVEATASVLRAKEGKCPEDGCVVKRDGKWRVVSNKTGKLWPQTYDSKKDATDAIASYHLRKKGVPPA